MFSYLIEYTFVCVCVCKKISSIFKFYFCFTSEVKRRRTDNSCINMDYIDVKKIYKYTSETVRAHTDGGVHARDIIVRRSDERPRAWSAAAPRGISLAGSLIRPPCRRSQSKPAQPPPRVRVAFFYSDHRPRPTRRAVRTSSYITRRECGDTRLNDNRIRCALSFLFSLSFS